MPRGPLVTVIVPLFNEAQDVATCLARIAAQSVGVEAIDLVLVDSASTDASVAVATAEARRLGMEPTWCTNPQRRTSVGLNAGLGRARGHYVVRVDARSRIQPDHVERCVRVLGDRPEVGVVGGAQLAEARSSSWRDRAIARALNNRWLMGLARYRRRGSSGPADTVWMGAFRTAQLRALGGWDDDTALNEDYELNERYRRAGAIVWFDTALRSGYVPRASVALVARQYRSFGRVKADAWVQGRRPSPRQVVLLASLPAAVVLGGVAATLLGIGVVVAAAVVVAVALDAVGGAGRAGPLDRLAALSVNAVIACSWWWGVVCGFVASRRGRRPHGALAARPTR